jgi:CHAT domain-containing protein
MIAFVLGLLLFLPPADTTPDRSPCDSLLFTADQRFEDWSNLQERWFNRNAEETARMRATIDLYRQARTCYGSRRPDLIWETYYDEAFLHAALRQFESAFATLDAFFKRYQTASPPSLSAFPPSLLADAGRIFQARAYLHYRIGNLGDALGDYSRAIAVTPDSLPVLKAKITRDLGVMHQQTGDFRVGLSYYERADRILEGDAAPDTDEVRALRARILTSKADLLVEETENGSFDPEAFQKALALLRESRDITPEQNGPQVARRLIFTAVVLGYLDAPDEALLLLTDAARTAKRTDDARLQVLVPVTRGYLFMMQGRWAEARDELQSALPVVRSLRDIELERRVLRYLGRIESARQNWEAAEAHYRHGVELVEEQRASISATQWALTAFGEWQQVHRGLVRVLLAQSRPVEAFHVLEKTRARHLTDLRAKATLSRELSATKRIRYDSLAQELTAVRSRLGTELPDSDAKTRLQAMETELMAQRRELLDLSVSVERGPSLSAIQRALERQNRSLVSYFVDDSNPYLRQTPTSAAFVVTPDTLRAVPLSGLTRDSMRAMNRRVSPLFDSDDSSLTLNAQHFDLTALHDLHEAVMAPVASHVAPNRPLVMVPDGLLFQIPFAMLVTSEPPNRFAYDQAQYVVDERPTSVELASRLVADTSRTPPDTLNPDADIAAYGVSRFDSVRAPSSLRSILPASYADSAHIRLPPLPGVERELSEVRRMYDRSKVALNGQATEASLRASLSNTRILHLASHAFAHPSSPLYNAFVLRNDRRDSTDDGVLFLHEVRTEAAPIPFVVLSGCSTARGTLWSGEGMQGPQYGFRAMGARATLSNLWPAADRALVSLSTAFYRHLRNGAPKDVALRRAQLEYMDAHPDRQSPFFWASTILYGSPAPLPPQSSPTPWWMYALVVLVLLSVAVGLQHHRSSARWPFASDAASRPSA